MNLKLACFLFLSFPLIAQGVLVIDVRTTQEWQSGHLEEAMHIEWQDILSISESVSKDKEIYLYCRSGNRSGKATKILIDAGYINAINAGSIQEANNLLKSKIIK
jgi:phage shock protein E